MHDADKLIMYLFMQGELTAIQHVRQAKHHPFNNLVEAEYRKEMAIDCKCACLSKPDKSLNAFDTLIQN